jgi:4-amino-4-deoxy-L-arabinose transferase-like glycosyltransferase
MTLWTSRPLGDAWRGLWSAQTLPSPALMRRIYWAAALAFVPTVFLQYVGEEPVTVLVAQEMRASGDFIVTTLYGHNYGRPGLFAWLMLPIAGLIGWDHVLMAARVVAIVSTVLTGLTLFWLVRRIFKEELLAAFSAAVYLSGDVLMYRGWLAYADPLFAFLTFAAMTCLWIAVAERRHDFLVLGALALIGTFLTKTVTGYAFYGVLALVLAWRHQNRTFLVRPVSLALHAAAVAFPFIWDERIADHAVLSTATQHIAFHLNDLDAPDPLGYVWHIVRYPFRTAWYLLPTSAIAIVCLARRVAPLAFLSRPPIDIAAFGLLLNVIPYWLAPSGGTRYLMPIYPLFALVMTAIVLRAGAAVAGLTVKALIATVGIAYVIALFGFPLYERYVRGSYAQAAQEILARVGDAPLYALDTSSVGASVVANLNVLRMPELPIREPPPAWSSGFVLASGPDEAVGQIAALVTIGRQTRYLLCRGAACDRPS